MIASGTPAPLTDLGEPLLASPENAYEEEDPSGVLAVSPTPVRVYRARWLVLSMLSFSSMTSAMLWITFSPIASHVEEVYRVSSMQVNGLSLVFIGAYLPMSLVSSSVYHRWGVRNGILLAVALNCASGLFRFLSTVSVTTATQAHSYSMLLLGQSLGALAQPFLTNIPAKLSSVWFPPTERDVAVAIGSLSNAIGIMVGSILSVFYSIAGDDGIDERVDMYGLLRTEFGVTLVNLVFVILLFQDRPPTPPSLSESSRNTRPPLTLSQELKLLGTNRDFILLTVTFGVLGLSVFNTLLTLMEQLVTPAGYNSDDASWFLGWMIVSGIGSAFCVGLILDRTHAYNRILKTGFVCSMLSFNAMLLTLRPNQSTLLTVLFACMGASMMPLLPISIECACECTYPVSEDVSSGLLQSASQLSAPIFILGTSALLNKQHSYTTYRMEPAYWVFSITSFLFVGGIMFYNGAYRRLEAEEEQAAPKQRGTSEQ